MKNLIRKLKPLLKNKLITDIILFGSNAKGKINPSDIDIAVMVKEKDVAILDMFKDFKDIDIQLLSLEDIDKQIFFTLIKEGYSVRKDKYLHESYNISPVKLYKYDLRKLTSSKKVMFERGIKTINGLNRLSNSVVLVPIRYTGEFEDFLKNWGLDIETQEYELVPIMRKEELF